jgi:hypothetical protein
VTFDGAANIDYRGASQTAVVAPGRYRFTAVLRTEGITTNQGIGFRLFDPESPQRLDVRTAQLTGNNGWTELATGFTVSARTNLVTVQLDRQPSAKFDNKIAGTAWIDSVKLTSVVGSKSR